MLYRKNSTVTVSVVLLRKDIHFFVYLLICFRSVTYLCVPEMRDEYSFNLMSF